MPRIVFSFCSLALALLLASAPAFALQRTSVRMDRNAGDEWDAAATCSVTYANTCTGWLWVWSDWEPLESFGVVFEPCCEGGVLKSTQTYFWTGAPAGWGFTGTLSIRTVVFDCPGDVIASRPYLPQVGPTIDFWTAPAGPVVLMHRVGPGWGNFATLPTDHPAAGPTGPQACGFCFPTTRVVHTFRFGTPDSPLCPGEPFNDGICDAEALLWYAGFDCPAVGVQLTTWAALKALYR